MQSFPPKRLLLLYLVNRPTSLNRFTHESHFRFVIRKAAYILLNHSTIIVVNYHRVVIANKLSAGIVYCTWRWLRWQRASSWMYFEQGDAAWRSSRYHWKYQLAATKVTRKNRNGGKWASGLRDEIDLEENIVQKAQQNEHSDEYPGTVLSTFR